MSPTAPIALLRLARREQSDGSHASEGLLLECEREPEAGRCQVGDQLFCRPIVGDRDRQVDIAREPRLDADGHCQPADQGPRLRPIVEQTPDTAQDDEQARAVRHVRHGNSSCGPSPCSAPGRSCSQCASRRSTSVVVSAGSDRRMAWRRSATAVAHRSTAVWKRSLSMPEVGIALVYDAAPTRS
jgi:hypothetical protein